MLKISNAFMWNTACGTQAKVGVPDNYLLGINLSKYFNPNKVTTKTVTDISDFIQESLQVTIGLIFYPCAQILVSYEASIFQKCQRKQISQVTRRVGYIEVVVETIQFQRIVKTPHTGCARVSHLKYALVVKCFVTKCIKIEYGKNIMSVAS
mmetsp:Transcript_8142/g.11984  ORF Transcript_8142/g.11984 Transcript_8142/m.11984 type:complete len:152 (-) Transcript_8142:563-1018(-)